MSASPPCSAVCPSPQTQAASTPPPAPPTNPATASTNASRSSSATVARMPAPAPGGALAFSIRPPLGPVHTAPGASLRLPISLPHVHTCPTAATLAGQRAAGATRGGADVYVIVAVGKVKRERLDDYLVEIRLDA